jgi:hypothetical protein
MEDINGQQTIWKLEPKPKRIRFLETEPPSSLLNLLRDGAKMWPQEKRELALICAYSLLLFHDSRWLRKGCDKTKLSFFYKLDSDPDYARPYISTRFEIPDRASGRKGIEGAVRETVDGLMGKEDGEESKEKGDNNTEDDNKVPEVAHRNFNILALGILLIEIFNEKQIENWRTKVERETVTVKTEANINLAVANRVVRKMEKSPSTSAIEACLDLDWVPEDQDVNLEDAEIRSGLYLRVVQPLEDEISWIT